MSLTFKISAFEGPLDLLLQMVEQEELAITAVSLAHITDQYIEYLEHAQTIPKEELADFLLVAARLLFIKSRALLPQMAVPLDESGISLEDQLRMYQQFAHAAQAINGLIQQKRFLFPREKPPIQMGVFLPPRTVSAERLAQIFRELLRAIAPVVRFPKAAVERAVSIQEKMHELRTLLSAQGELSFHTFLRAAASTTEVVVSFLALLEMVKQRTVRVSQEALFHDITVGISETQNA